MNDEYFYNFKRLQKTKEKFWLNKKFMTKISKDKITKYGENFFKEKKNAIKYMFVNDTKAINLMRKYYYMSNNLTFFQFENFLQFLNDFFTDVFINFENKKSFVINNSYLHFKQFGAELICSKPG